MTEFTKELEAKAYALVNGSLELEDFRAWYRLAIVAAAPARKDGEFSDYYKTEYEPMDGAMEAHHRKLMGSGDR